MGVIEQIWFHIVVYVVAFATQLLNQSIDWWSLIEFQSILRLLAQC